MALLPGCTTAASKTANNSKKQFLHELSIQLHTLTSCCWGDTPLVTAAPSALPSTLAMKGRTTMRGTWKTKCRDEAASVAHKVVPSCTASIEHNKCTCNQSMHDTQTRMINKLTSASRRARRISRRGAFMFSGVNRASFCTMPHALFRDWDRVSNMAARVTS